MFDPNDTHDIMVYDPRKDNNDQWLLPLNYNIEDMDMFCSYVMNMSDTVSRSALTNLQTMFEIMDMRPYSNNDLMLSRIEFIKLALDARLNLELERKRLIITHIQRNCDKHYEDLIENIIENIQKISESSCKYINQTVFENLLEGYSMVYAKKLNKLFLKQDQGYYKTMKDFSADFKNLMASYQDTFYRIEKYNKSTNEFDLSVGNIKSKVKGFLKRIKAPSNKLKTGLQYLNRMFNGGLESGRSYLFMGVTGVGKSIVLLSVASWIAKYNVLPKPEGVKSLAVLFISQENSDIETFERYFNINATSGNIKDYDEDSLIDELMRNNLLLGDDSNGINIVFKFFSDREIGVTDIDRMIADYEKDGIHIVAVVQDYIEKLNPKFKFTELRHALGSIATELSELAKKYNIPVISAAQLNRTASSTIDNAIANNKKNTTKLLGKQNVSESWDMMKNVDAAVIINREVDDRSGSEKEYLGFKLEKYRGKPSDDKIFLFLHPFDEHNGILLTPDIDTKPLSRTSIEDFEPMGGTTNNTPIKFYDDDSFESDFIDLIDGDFKDNDKNYNDLLNAVNTIEEHDKEEQSKPMITISKLVPPKYEYGSDGSIRIDRSERFKNKPYLIERKRG